MSAIPSSSPLVSVIVPIYNRLVFLPQLLNTLKAQTYQNLEFILVDDGSTDGSTQWLKEHVSELGDNATVLEQPNAGAYDARNNGLDHAKGEFIAFQDSDDEWPEYHIERMVGYMQQSPNIDWLFGSLQRIKHGSNEIVEASNIVAADGSVHPFIGLKHEKVGPVKIYDNESAGVSAIIDRIPGSTQSALIRSSLFRSMRFDPTYRTAYDQFFALKCLLKGFVFAYVDELHQIYHVHEDHISLVAGGSAEKRIRSALTHIRGYREVYGVANTDQERNAAKQKMADYCAWMLSIAYREQDDFNNENKAMWQAVKLQPTNLKFVKTFVLSTLRRIGVGR